MGPAERRSRRTGRFGALAVACLAAIVMTAGPAAADVDTVSGSAFGEQIDVTPLGLANVSSGPLPAVSFTDPDDGPGPHTDQTLGVTTVGLLGGIATLGIMNVSTERTGTLGTHFAGAESSASVADVNLLDGALTATLISSECRADAEGVSGTTTLAGVNVPDFLDPIALEPAPNTEILLPGLRIVLNEQIENRSGQTNAIEVNAVHVYLSEPLGSGDIIIAQSKCSATGPDVIIPAGTIGGIGLAGLLGVLFVGMQVRRNRARRRGQVLAQP